MNQLILLRHGQSQWNLENRFTGWKDVPLTKKGIAEAKSAGILMKKHKINIDIVFSSILQRANKTAEYALKEMSLDNLWQNNELIVTRDLSLNERDYGDLVGLNKEETSKKYGKKLVHMWRRSFDVSPPGGESLKDVLARVGAYYDKFIEPEIKNNKNILVVAHGNSLRATLIRIGLYKAQEISQIEIPTGKPLVINFTSGKIANFQYIS